MWRHRYLGWDNSLCTATRLRKFLERRRKPEVSVWPSFPRFLLWRHGRLPVFRCNSQVVGAVCLLHFRKNELFEALYTVVQAMSCWGKVLFCVTVFISLVSCSKLEKKVLLLQPTCNASRRNINSVYPQQISFLLQQIVQQGLSSLSIVSRSMSTQSQSLVCSCSCVTKLCNAMQANMQRHPSFTPRELNWYALFIMLVHFDRA